MGLTVKRRRPRWRIQVVARANGRFLLQSWDSLEPYGALVERERIAWQLARWAWGYTWPALATAMAAPPGARQRGDAPPLSREAG